VEQLVRIGVNEVACLLDFGPEPDAILGELESLDRLRRRFAERGETTASILAPGDRARAVPDPERCSAFTAG
jgi:hypothetical protein